MTNNQSDDRVRKLEEIARDAVQALEDLSFECFGVVEVNRPSLETYNRTFGVLERTRKLLAELKEGKMTTKPVKTDAEGPTLLEQWLDESSENRRLFAQEGLILEVSEAIYAALENFGKKKVDIANALNVNKAYISQVLSGSRNITLRTLSDICFAIGIEPVISIDRHDSPELVRLRQLLKTARTLIWYSNWAARKMAQNHSAPHHAEVDSLMAIYPAMDAWLLKYDGDLSINFRDAHDELDALLSQPKTGDE